jgi:hypothetical protein
MNLMSSITRRVARVALMLLVATPAFAQVDLNGGWTNIGTEDWIERWPGHDPVDYTGLPLSDAGRAEALSYTYAELSMYERQCKFYGPQYINFGPQSLRIWSETDPVRGDVVAWRISAAIDRDIVTIWMDGREHPSENAFYPFSAFTTGRWEGDTLVAYSTHNKMAYARRNGAPISDRNEVEWRIWRNDDLLTIMTIVHDPVYLAEPHVVTRTWRLDERSNASPVPNPCIPVTEVHWLENFGAVPHQLPGKNPDVDYLTKTYNVPREAVLGYQETLYPEYRKKMAAQYEIPPQCGRYCCGWTALGGPGSAPGLTCISDGSGKPYVHPPAPPFERPLRPAQASSTQR